jgi:hypothetical protein
MYIVYHNQRRGDITALHQREAWRFGWDTMREGEQLDWRAWQRLEANDFNAEKETKNTAQV